MCLLSGDQSGAGFFLQFRELFSACLRVTMMFTVMFTVMFGL